MILSHHDPVLSTYSFEGEAFFSSGHFLIGGLTRTDEGDIFSMKENFIH